MVCCKIGYIYYVFLAIKSVCLFWCSMLHLRFSLMLVQSILAQPGHFRGQGRWWCNKLVSISYNSGRLKR